MTRNILLRIRKITRSLIATGCVTTLILTGCTDVASVEVNLPASVVAYQTAEWDLFDKIDEDKNIDLVRHNFKNKQECVDAFDEAQCEKTESKSGTSSGEHYVGPLLYPMPNSGYYRFHPSGNLAPVTVSNIGSATVTTVSAKPSQIYGPNSIMGTTSKYSSPSANGTFARLSSQARSVAISRGGFGGRGGVGSSGGG